MELKRSCTREAIETLAELMHNDSDERVSGSARCAHAKSNAFPYIASRMILLPYLALRLGETF